MIHHKQGFNRIRGLADQEQASDRLNDPGHSRYPIHLSGLHSSRTNGGQTSYLSPAYGAYVPDESSRWDCLAVSSQCHQNCFDHERAELLSTRLSMSQ